MNGMPITPLVQDEEDRDCLVSWLDGEIGRWQKIGEDHTTRSMQEAARHYVDCLLTVRRAVTGQTKARKRDDHAV